MISVSKSGDGTVATLSGDGSELMLFFCIWQTALWPDWIAATVDHVGGIRDHKAAVRAIRDTGELLLHDGSRIFEDACVFAIDRCRVLGVEVST